MLKRTGTKHQRSDDRTTNLSRLIIIGGNLVRIDLFSVATVRGNKNVWWGNQGILGVGNRHDNIDPSFYYYAYTNTKCVLLRRKRKKEVATTS